jgi:hypothetical protein
MSSIETKTFRCANYSFDEDLYKYDKQMEKLNNDAKNRIEHDIFIGESINILLDYLKQI